MAISDWPRAERPREKLIEKGPMALSDAELLAIFLRTGLRGKSAVDLARQLMLEFGGLRSLLQADRKYQRQMLQLLSDVEARRVAREGAADVATQRREGSEAGEARRILDLQPASARTF